MNILTNRFKVRKGIAGEWLMKGNALDTSGNGNHGTLQGGASIANNELVLDGIDDYLDLGNNSRYDFTTSDFTYNFKIKINSVANNPVLFCKGSYNSSGTYCQIFSNNLFWGTQQTSANTTISSSSKPITTGNYLDIVFIKQGTAGIIYVNNSLVASGTLNNPISTSNNLFIGAYQSSSLHLNSNIKKIKCWNRALTATEALKLAKMNYY